MHATAFNKKKFPISSKIHKTTLSLPISTMHSKEDILKEFETRLKSDNIEQELDKSINQVKKIATLRLNEIIHE